MQGIALVIAAVNVILRHLGALPESAEVHELRERAFSYINEVVMWSTSRPSAEQRDALMMKVLDLHVSVNRHLPLGESLGTNKSSDAPSTVRYPSPVPPA
jgi:hypothetical protein